MLPNIPIHPEQASTIAQQVDYLYFVLTGVALFFTVLIFLMIFYFMIRYRRRSSSERPADVPTSIPLEIAWTAIPSLICIGLYIWGATQFVANARTPQGAMEIFVTGRQWMWKVQHPEGMREINELHVPVGRPVRLTLTSEDVIHDFFVPAFRVKKDVLPGRYVSLWFTATKVGRYHLFCAQYCGAFHAGMGGWVVVMREDEYQKWLAGNATDQSMVATGQELFAERGCAECHLPDGSGRGPSLDGLFGQNVRLANGDMAIVNESYLREAILHPRSAAVPGYNAAMPSYQGQLNDEQVLDLIAYLRSLPQAGPQAGNKP